MYIYTAHVYDAAHLTKVMKEAKRYGKVKLDAYYDGKSYYVLDGVHRTESAKRLGIPLILIQSSEKKMMSTFVKGHPVIITIGEILQHYWNNGMCYHFDEFTSVKVKK